MRKRQEHPKDSLDEHQERRERSAGGINNKRGESGGRKRKRQGMINQTKGNPVKCAVKVSLRGSSGEGERGDQEEQKKWILIPKRHINFGSFSFLFPLRGWRGWKECVSSFLVLLVLSKSSSYLSFASCDSCSTQEETNCGLGI